MSRENSAKNRYRSRSPRVSRRSSTASFSANTPTAVSVGLKPCRARVRARSASRSRSAVKASSPSWWSPLRAAEVSESNISVTSRSSSAWVIRPARARLAAVFQR